MHRLRSGWSLAIAAAMLALSWATTAAAQGEDEIQAVLDRWSQVYATATDAAEMLELYDPDAVFFGTGSQTPMVGAAIFAPYFQNQFDNFKDRSHSFIDPIIRIHGDGAFATATGLYRFNVTPVTGGAPIDVLLRYSLAFIRTEAGWLIVQQHSSALPSMILFPAIDLKDGDCVRLERGEMERATVFNKDPAAQARSFAEQGFAWLHIVDLDGAFAGRSVNAGAVGAILAAIDIPVQLGGGIRDMATIDAWLARGVARIILGTAAVRDPNLVRAACQQNPGRIAVGIDARGGKVAVEGWAATSELTAIDLAKRFEDAGVAAIIYTDIDRDGVFAGLNFDATLALADAVSIPIIASGGLASLADVERLTEPRYHKLAGAIAGRALYDGRLDPAAALRVLSEAA